LVDSEYFSWSAVSGFLFAISCKHAQKAPSFWRHAFAILSETSEEYKYEIERK
jgi:hypothetical protein